MNIKTLKIILDILVIVLVFISIWRVKLNTTLHMNIKDLIKNKKRLVFAIIYSILVISAIILFLFVNTKMYNQYGFKSIESAEKFIDVKQIELLYSNDNTKVYLESKVNDHNKTIRCINEYKYRNNKWYINSDINKTHMYKTLDKLREDSIWPYYYLNIYKYEIDYKMIVYMECEEKYPDACDNLVITDSMNNTFEFKDKNYDYKILEGYNSDYYYIHDNKNYGLE